MEKLERYYKQFMLFAALSVLGWGGFIYVNDIRALSEDMSIRNIGWVHNEICNGNDDEQMWQYLAEQVARYNRYADHEHRFTGVTNQGDLCGD